MNIPQSPNLTEHSLYFPLEYQALIRATIFILGAM